MKALRTLSWPIKTLVIIGWENNFFTRYVFYESRLFKVISVQMLQNILRAIVNIITVVVIIIWHVSMEINKLPIRKKN